MALAVSSLPDFTGRFINGHFELVQMLGTGGYGVVYKAVDTLLPPTAPGHYRAIKIICKVGRSTSELASLRREVILHKLVGNRPGVVGIHAAFEDDKYCYIVLDFIPGGDLFGQITEKQAYAGNDELLRKAFLSLVDAVQACHNARIAHRDLKPENILTSKDGAEVYLADFGMATNKREVSQFGAGTNIYMSPECFGELYGHKPYNPLLCDIWSLGVVLVNMISGRNPWSKPTSSDPSFARFLKSPGFLLKQLPISKGVHDILLRTFDLCPIKRIMLPDLRRAISELDTFFSPEYKARHRSTHEPKQLRIILPFARPVSETLAKRKSPLSNTMASEIDISVSPRPAAREGGDCSAGSAFDASTAATTTTTSAAFTLSSCSDWSAWSEDSDKQDVITPETSDWRREKADWRKGFGEVGRKQLMTAQLLIE